MELQELKQHIDLETFLVDQGYSRNKEKSTRNIPVYENEHEKLVVRQGNDCKTYYVIESEEKGTIIDFLKNRPDLLTKFPAKNIFESIKGFLNHYSGTGIHICASNNITPPIVSFNPDLFFVLRDKDINKRCFYYLAKRHIKQATLLSEIFNNTGLVKIKGKNENYFYNLEFPLFDNSGTIKAIDYRFIGLDGKNYKMFVEGSNKKDSIGISSNKRTNIKELILVESPIDAMSHYQAHRNNQQDVQYIYFDGTITKGQIKTFLEYKALLTSPIITLAFDNDIAERPTGQLYTASILCSILVQEPVMSIFESNQNYALVTNAIHHEKLSSISHQIPQSTLSIIGHELRFSFPREKQIINRINHVLTRILPFTRIEQSFLKDWNDDLRMYLSRRELPLSL